MNQSQPEQARYTVFVGHDWPLATVRSLADEALTEAQAACRRRRFLEPAKLDSLSGIVRDTCMTRVELGDQEAAFSCVDRACPAGYGCTEAARLLLDKLDIDGG